MADNHFPEKKFRKLIADFHAGKVDRSDLAKNIHEQSTSISLDWLVQSLQSLFPAAKINYRTVEVKVDLLCATQSRMEKPKYELVCLLFDSAETFDAYNEDFFSDHPITIMHIGGGRYAILDGHHRVRRFAELTGSQRPLKVTMIHSTSLELRSRFREEVEEVRQETGTADVRELPLL